MFDPLVLIDETVVVNVKSLKKAPAMVQQQGDIFIVTISEEFVSQFDEEESIVIHNGLVLHEIAHIKYGSFGKKKKVSYQNQQLWNWLDNLLEDARIEYRLSKDYPIAAKYFKVVMAAVKNDGMKVVQGAQANTSKDESETLKKINEKLKQLYSICRWGTIPNDIDDNFASVVIPILMAAQRGGRTNSVDAVDHIYRSVVYDINQLKYNYMFAGEAMDQYAEEAAKGMKIKECDNDAQSLIKDVINEEKANNKMQANDEDDAKGKQDGLFKVTRQLDLNYEFYSKTTAKYGKQIMELIEVFSNMFKKWQIRKAKEGDMNLKKIQDAYIASMTADEGNYFVRYCREKPEFDAIIFRDISGSIDREKEQYAEAAIVVAEALGNFKDVNIGVVDFGSEANMVKYMDEQLMSARIIPISEGSTALGQAMQAVIKEERMQWSKDKKLCIIVTDGQPDSMVDIEEALRDKFYEGVTFITVIIAAIRNSWVESYERVFGEVNVINSIDGMPAEVLLQIEKLLVN